MPEILPDGQIVLTQNDSNEDSFHSDKMVYAVDLDGTLAEYHGWQGRDVIGAPIPSMMKRVQQWLANGDKVVIFTARAHNPGNIPVVQTWLIQHGLPALDVTDKKDHSWNEIWDDKAVHVQQNTGKILG